MIWKLTPFVCTTHCPMMGEGLLLKNGLDKIKGLSRKAVFIMSARNRIEKMSYSY